MDTKKEIKSFRGLEKVLLVSYQLLVTGYSLLVTRCWLRLLGFSLATGYWLLVTSYSLLVTPLVFAAPGRSTANYLKVDVSAKAAAMGGNQFGTEDDSFAQFYNPAFLSAPSQKEVGFMHNELFQDLRQELFTYLQPTDRFGNLAGVVNYFSYGKISGYTADGLPTGDISADDLLLGASWAIPLSSLFDKEGLREISAGTSIKILRKTLADNSAVGFAIDLGFSYPITGGYLKRLRLAGAVQNLGQGLKFESESSPLLRTVRIGAAYPIWGEAITIAMDGVMTSDDSLFPAIGIEYKILRMLSVRFGYKGNTKLNHNFTYGVGFENPIFRLDYAIVPFGELGNTHRISAVFRFGKNYKQPKASSQIRERVKEASTLYAQGQLLDAYLIAFQIEQVAPWHSENNKLLLSIQKDFRELEESHRKAELLQQVTAIFNRGEKFYEEGNLINARLDFRSVLGLQPDNRAAQGYLKQIEGQFQSFVQSFYENGMVAFAAEDYERAKEEFEKVLVIKPDHVDAKAQLARTIDILEKRKRETVVAEQKNILSRTYKNALDVYKKEKYEDAIPLFYEVLKIKADDDEAKRYISLCRETLFSQYLDRGQKFAGKGEWESAIRNIKKSLEYNSDSREAENLLQDVQRRWELQRKVLSQNLYKEGLELFLSGDKNKARTLWQRAVDLDPENEEAKRGLSRIIP